MSNETTAKPCPACGFAGPPGMRFCGACGQFLSDLARAAAPAPKPTPKPRVKRAPRKRAAVAQPRLERRQLTVMFCDLADSTRLSGMLDPEDLGRVLMSYRDACVAAIEPHGGVIARFVGDGLLVYFGYPVAHEDDPQRALRAALGVQQRMEALNGTLKRGGLEPLGVRIGIHTGLVVVGDLRTGSHVEEQGVVGETPNLAARLQSVARPGNVVVSEDTRRLCEGYFRFQAKGEQALVGIARPVRAYLVRAEVPLRERLAARRRDTPLVGRAVELGQLMAAWRAASGGAGRVVVVEGEAGIGKSRLVQEMRGRIGPAGLGAFTVLCAEDGQGSAFHPLAEWLRSMLDIEPGSDPDAARPLLDGVLDGLGLSRAAHAAPLAVLIGLATSEEEAEAAGNPRRHRRRLVDALGRVVLAAAERGPLLVVVEDVHWADDSTLHVLTSLAERIAHAPVLMVVTGRTCPLPALPSMQRLRLERLSPSDARALISTLGGDAIPDADRARILDRTDGVPLFLEEVTWTALSGGDSGGQADIPMTLRDSLTARLDQLADAKPVAQLAAVLGRTFRADMIEAILAEELSEGRISVGAALERLAVARFIDPVVGAGQLSFVFRHALIQEAAYGSLLRERRQDYHARIARVLRARFPETVEARPELLAAHLAAGGNVAEALEYYGEAARVAARLAAHVEAMRHYQTALDLLRSGAEGIPDRDHREAALHIGLAGQMLIARGNAAPEVGHALTRAREIADGLGSEMLRFRTLRSLQTFHMVRGNMEDAYEISRSLREWALERGDPDVLVQTHRPYGLCLLYLGRFDEARAELARTLDLYDPDRHAAHRFEYGSDPAVLARAHLGWVDWFLGHEAAARGHVADAIAAARALDHPHSLCFALAFQACLAQFRGDPAAAFAAAEEMGRISTKHDYLYWSAWSDILQGWAVARGAAPGDGERLLHDGLSRYVATGAGLLRPYALHLLAETLPPERAGEAAALAAQALAEAEAQSILFYRTEMLRLKERLEKAGRLDDLA